LYLTTRSRYGTRLLLDIARHQENGPVPISDISRRQDVSVKYLEMIVRDLKQAGYILSRRGARGGHMLAKEPGSVTVGEIVELLEGDTFLVPCAQSEEHCARAPRCPTRWIWKEMSEAVRERLYSITFAKLLEKSADQEQDPIDNQG
jgi:Rrf2 family protein